MTLLTTIFAAVICTVIWYKNAPDNTMKVGVLCWLYWGASLMWLVGAIFEYCELGAEYFTPSPADMLNELISRTVSGCAWTGYMGNHFVGEGS